MTQVSNDLPQGWVLSSLGDLAILNPKKQENSSGDTEVSFIPMKSVEPMTGVVDLSEARKVSEVQKGYTRFIDGDVLFAKITPCMENGKVAIVTGLRKGIGYGSTEFHVVRLNHALERKYFFFYLIQDGFRKEAQRNMTGTAGQLRVPIKYLKEAGVPVPPLNEQHSIVAKIEELFTNLDAGVEAMKIVQAQIKRYRQAVLKYAFEGKLTAEWREAHKNELVPALVLLARIREERKKKLGGKYKEPPAVDTSDLPELPDGWKWVNFNQIVDGSRNAMKAGPFGSALKKEYYVKSGYKIYGQEQVIRGDPHYGDYYIDENRYRTLESCTVQPGDVLISLVGTIGKVLILPDDIEAGIINPRLVKITLNQTVAKSRYIKAFIESEVVRHFFSLGSHGGTMDILNLTILKGLPIPLPPIKEQEVVVEEIERRLSISDAIMNTIQQGLQQSTRLRQSILKKAFEGKLVPQDPNDEPADKLLERIKKERDKQLVGAKKTRSRKHS